MLFQTFPKLSLFYSYVIYCFGCFFVICVICAQNCPQQSNTSCSFFIFFIAISCSHWWTWSCKTFSSGFVTTAIGRKYVQGYELPHLLLLSNASNRLVKTRWRWRSVSSMNCIPGMFRMSEAFLHQRWIMCIFRPVLTSDRFHTFFISHRHGYTVGLQRNYVWYSKIETMQH